MKDNPVSEELPKHCLFVSNVQLLVVYLLQTQSTKLICTRKHEFATHVPQTFSKRALQVECHAIFTRIQYHADLISVIIMSAVL